MNKLGSVKVRQKNGRRMVAYNHITLVKPHNKFEQGQTSGTVLGDTKRRVTPTTIPDTVKNACYISLRLFACMIQGEADTSERMENSGNATLAQTNLTGEKWVTNMTWMVRKARVVCVFCFYEKQGWLIARRLSWTATAASSKAAGRL